MKPEPILKWLAIAAIAFGVLTVFSGSRALFGNPDQRAALGNVVSFVLWFNFVAGFVYVLAGVGLLRVDRRAISIALFLAVATVLVSMAFAAHVIAGGAFEARTVGALLIRSLFWSAVAFVALRTARVTSVRTEP